MGGASFTVIARPSSNTPVIEAGNVVVLDSDLYKSIFRENFYDKNQKFASYSRVSVVLCVFQDKMLNKIRNTRKDPHLKKSQ